MEGINRGFTISELAFLAMLGKSGNVKKEKLFSLGMSPSLLKKLVYHGILVPVTEHLPTEYYKVDDVLLQAIVR